MAKRLVARNFESAPFGAPVGQQRPGIGLDFYEQKLFFCYIIISDYNIKHYLFVTCFCFQTLAIGVAEVYTSQGCMVLLQWEK